VWQLLHHVGKDQSLKVGKNLSTEVGDDETRKRQEASHLRGDEFVIALATRASR